MDKEKQGLEQHMQNSVEEVLEKMGLRFGGRLITARVKDSSVAGEHQRIAKRAPSILRTKPRRERKRFFSNLLNSVSKNHQKSVSRKRHDPRKQSLGKKDIGLCR